MRRREQHHEFFVAVVGFRSCFLIRHENDVFVAAPVDPIREFIEMPNYDSLLPYVAAS